MEATNKKNSKWFRNYEILKEYYREYGNIDVPRLYKVNNINLGTWLNIQRQAYKGNETHKITKYQIELLNDLGMKWNLREENWDENYYLLEDYYREHGNIDVPRLYEVNGIKLGFWLKNQRQAYKGNSTCKITEDQIELLNDLGIDWNIRDTKFLNETITEENIEKYNEVLKNRLNHILDDLMYEGFNEINNLEDQKQVEKIMVKRLWR